MSEGGPAVTIQRLDLTRLTRLQLAMMHMAIMYPLSHQSITSLRKTLRSLVRACNTNKNRPRVFNSPRQNDPFTGILLSQKPVAMSTGPGLPSRTKAGDTNLALSHSLLH